MRSARCKGSDGRCVWPLVGMLVGDGGALVRSRRVRGPRRPRSERVGAEEAGGQGQVAVASLVRPHARRPRTTPRGSRGARGRPLKGDSGAPARRSVMPPRAANAKARPQLRLPPLASAKPSSTPRPVADADFAGGRFADEASVRRWRHAWRRCRQALPSGHTSVHDMISSIH